MSCRDFNIKSNSLNSDERGFDLIVVGGIRHLVALLSPYVQDVAAGSMFWFTRNRFFGSYLALTDGAAIGPRRDSLGPGGRPENGEPLDVVEHVCA
jgi:hypothetical protein